MQERVLFLTQHFRPEQIGSAPYCVDIARWLGESGFGVDVVTAHPHYPDAGLFEAVRYPDSETARNFTLTRLNFRGPAGRSAAQRILGEVRFLLIGLAALASGRFRRSAVVLSLSPSILCVALGIVARRRKGRHVALVHDIQSGLAGGLGMVRSAWLLRIMRFVERCVLNRVDAVAVLTPEMAAMLRANGVRRPIEVVPLWVDAAAIVPTAKPAGDRMTLLYSGNLGQKQGLGQLCDLADELQRRQAGADLLVRGSGGALPELAADAERRGLRNMRFEPLLPDVAFHRGLLEGDIHLVPQNPKAADFAMPSKVFNIMAAARPFVATAAPGSALWRLAGESDAFVCVPPGDTAAFADAVGALLENPDERARLGFNGRRYVEENHQRPAVLRKLTTMLEGASTEVDRRVRTGGIVIFEPSHEGHPPEWLDHIVRFAAAERRGMPIHLVVAPELRDRFADDDGDTAGGGIDVVALTERERRLCTHGNLAVSAFARWWTMRRYIRRFRASHGHFLSLDHLSLPLALGLSAGGAMLDGILFRPSVHYRELCDYRPSWRERVRDFRKNVLYRGMLRNKAVDRVLTLDPFFANYAAAHYADGGKVRLLPDPAQAEAGESAHVQVKQKASHRIGFLLFGYLAERKGVLTLLEALKSMPRDLAAQLSLTLAGNIDPSVRTRLLKAMGEATIHQPGVELVLQEGRISEDELARQLAACDVVLAPYQRFVGSSGVLIRAACARKPVLTQNFGLLHRLTVEYRLGLTANTSDPRSIAAAMATMIAQGPPSFIDVRMAERFIAERSPRSFAAGVLGAGALEPELRQTSA